ncbi:N-acetylneuraminate synthase [Labilithrix luteola]|uniref:N-acetylneuraminate synthase n=1 Tax=Labilithrix luteola TaxID=1391654 RepID=A0A0K1Q5P0_9BACT|nr:pseudaminic acid synthase [Labilithrix luteola]AKV01146.1 N-acetylneuraminate synthase [Labilithrix luteola]
MKAFDVAGRRIGEDERVFFIAELSANHGQNIDVAKRTIEAAAKAGADAIKLQTYTPDTLTLRSSAPPFVVTTANAWAGRTLHDLYAEAMTPWGWHAELKAVAEANGLVWFSTPFDPTATEFLEGLGMDIYKVASFEIVDLPLIERIAQTGKPMVISTGMASLSDIEAALSVCREAGNDRLVLLRCVSSYPARPDAMNLRSFETLRAFGTVLGLSDHTRDATVAIASVALGARVIEKHFILDRSLGGPDSFFSLEPDEFKSMVSAVRDLERALGAPRFGVSADEAGSAKFRRSLFVSADVAEGAVLTCDLVRSVRPADGLPPRELPAILGRRAARALKAATPLSWEDVGQRSPRAAVELRPALQGDADALLVWRNDATTRAMSIAQAEVERSEHEAWLARVLDAADRKLFVAELDGNAIGQVRLDKVGQSTWEVSITVAPEARGRRLSSSILGAVEAPARALGVKRLVATIRPENEASIRAFKCAGYYAFTERSQEGVRLLRCERRIVPYV